jgi:GntP family gluconate:H+ symporter
MSGMPLVQALLLLASVVLLVAATQARWLHAFFAILVIATAFGFAGGFSISFLGKTFGSGFSHSLYAPGLVLVAAAFVAGIAEASGAMGFLAAAARRRRWLGGTGLAALCGLAAGLCASPGAAFALLTPFARARADEAARPAPLALALALSGSHGVLLVSPVMIAATAILDASWTRALAFGVPLAIVLAAFGAAWARWLASPQSTPRSQPAVNSGGIFGARAQMSDAMPADFTVPKRSGWSAGVLLIATAVPLALLAEQSLGDIPSEPLGGGTARELVIGLGRPLILLLVGLGIMVLGNARLSRKLFADADWTSGIFGKIAGLLLTLGAVGGLQRLCQETGMAELLGERVAGWSIGGAALLVPFLVAATIKTLQGSSLVAAIATAGIMQPLLLPLGLGGENAKALAALAVGAGAMAVSHLNDDFFWLVSLTTGMRPARALAALTAGTLLQGILAALMLLSSLALLTHI